MTPTDFLRAMARRQRKVVASGGAASALEPGDRVRGIWDLATVLEVVDDGHVVIQFDEVDATGTRVAPGFRQPVVRNIRTLTKMPKDTPQVAERPAIEPPPRGTRITLLYGSQPPATTREATYICGCAPQYALCRCPEAPGLRPVRYDKEAIKP